MGDLENNPAYWRGNADEARAIADALRHAPARAHMLSAAASYERLAKLAERYELVKERAPKAANDDVP